MTVDLAGRWRHGWIPLDAAAALSKAKGNHAIAARLVKAKRGTPRHILEYRAARQAQDRRFESHHGAGVSVADTKSPEYQAYFGTGEHAGHQVEHRVTYKGHLANLSAQKQDARERADSYRRGHRLGAAHARTRDTSRHDAEYDMAASKASHDDHFAEGYAEGLVRGHVRRKRTVSMSAPASAVDLASRPSLSKASRAKAAKAGKALPGGGYPIRNRRELRAARILSGKSKRYSKAVIQAHIRRRARALGVTLSAGQASVLDLAVDQGVITLDLAGHWRHGWVPLDAAAVASKNHGRKRGNSYEHAAVTKLGLDKHHDAAKADTAAVIRRAAILHVSGRHKAAQQHLEQAKRAGHPDAERLTRIQKKLRLHAAGYRAAAMSLSGFGTLTEVLDLAGKWRHGWIPLDAAALASKRHGRKGGSLRDYHGGKPTSVGKTRTGSATTSRIAVGKGGREKSGKSAPIDKMATRGHTGGMTAARETGSLGGVNTDALMRAKTDEQLRRLIHNKASGVLSALASQEADRRGLALGRRGVHVQGHGLHPSERADAIRPGHTRVFNGPSHAEVTKVEHKGNMVHITTRASDGKEYTQRHHGATHLAVVKPRADQPKAKPEAKTGYVKREGTAAEPRPQGHYAAMNREMQAENAKKANLRITETTYRGKTGHLVSGTDASGRKPKVFTDKGRAHAEQVKANLAAGRDPFHGTTLPGPRPEALYFRASKAELQRMADRGDAKASAELARREAKRAGGGSIADQVNAGGTLSSAEVNALEHERHQLASSRAANATAARNGSERAIADRAAAAKRLGQIQRQLRKHYDARNAAQAGPKAETPAAAARPSMAERHAKIEQHRALTRDEATAKYGLENIAGKSEARYYIQHAAVMHDLGKHAEAQKFLEDQKLRRRAAVRADLTAAQRRLQERTPAAARRRELTQRAAAHQAPIVRRSKPTTTEAPASGRMTYRERRERRAERLRGWADKRQTNAAAVFKAGEPFRGDNAFNTQPGHIPFRARLIAREDRAHESVRKAQSMHERASGIESQLKSSIYSDDPDAVPALEARIAKLEKTREVIKARNAAYKKEHKAELAKLTPYGRDRAMPHPSYELTNLSGNINRQKKRLEQLRRQAK